MKERRPPRLYMTVRLAPGETVETEVGQAHYLRSVLRLGPGSVVAAFNQGDGEWLCRLAEIGKGGVWLKVERRLRPPKRETDLWLLFAPIKRARLDWLVEKATELGAAALLPVWTARTQAERINIERLRAHAIEAAQQSERLTVPELRPPQALERVLAGWRAALPLIVCDETGTGEPIAEVAARLARGPTALLIGPEGGFDQRELDAFGKLNFVTRVGLGPRVLRAETAAVAALAIFQAIAGDWRRSCAR